MPQMLPAAKLVNELKLFLRLLTLVVLSIVCFLRIIRPLTPVRMTSSSLIHTLQSRHILARAS